MAHFVTGLIAESTVIEAFAREHLLHGPIALLHGLAILPLREIDLELFHASPSENDTGGFQYLSKQLLDILRRLSHQGPLMYFETEYFGGMGGQGAAVFRDGELIFGPYWAEIGPINSSLNLLGITVEPPAHDEFETVGLHVHRNTEEWLK